MCRQLLFVLFILTDFQNVRSEESVNYLQNAIWDIENRINNFNTKRRIDSLQVISSPSVPDDGNQVPALALTKTELASLYEAIFTRQKNTNDKSLPHPPIVMEMHEDPGDKNKISDPDHAADSNGYYYYYYPINSFMDAISSANNHVDNYYDDQHISDDHHHHSDDHHPHSDDHHHHHADPHSGLDEKPPQFHAHTHEHKIHIVSAKDHEKKKVLEPLFMAVSSFIGMAVMFVLSIVFLPKFGGLKSRDVTPTGEVSNLIHVVFKAIEGNDCSERMACEMGKAAKVLNVNDNRFMKLFKRITPRDVGWYIDGIIKYAQTKITCGSIQCRRKKIPKSKYALRK